MISIMTSEMNMRAWRGLSPSGKDVPTQDSCREERLSNPATSFRCRSKIVGRRPMATTKVKSAFRGSMCVCGVSVGQNKVAAIRLGYTGRLGAVVEPMCRSWSLESSGLGSRYTPKPKAHTH